MKKSVAVVLGVLLAGSAAFAGETVTAVGSVILNDVVNAVEGNGVSRNETRELSFFNAVSLKGDYDVTIVCGKKPKIEITCDGNILPHIIAKVEDDRLFTYLSKPVIQTSVIKMKIFTGSLAEISASGKNNLIVSGIQNSRLTLHIKGAGNICLTGKTEELTAVLSGRVTLDAGNLASEVCRITTAGNGNATVRVSEFLEGKIRGIGKISYYGNPGEIRKDISGLGKMEAL